MTALLTHPRYESRETLGEGAQGFVVRVVDRDARSRKLVAKVWRTSMVSQVALRGELSLLSRLRVDGIVRAHDFSRDTATGAPFLVEDFVDGMDAKAFIAAAPIDERRARLVRMLAELSTSLGALHAGGFSHGDVKSVHVRVPEGGRAMLLDLGSAIAHAARDSAPAMTAGYAAPEVEAGGRATPQSDLFALGALVWACATGSPPKRGQGTRNLSALTSWVPPALSDLVAALLNGHPADRPASTREVLSAIGATSLLPPSFSLPSPLGRDAELRTLESLSMAPGVHYVAAPSGFGKSHLLRELGTRELLRGRDVRVISFPLEAPEERAGLLAFLRGERASLSDRGPDSLLVFDELHAAPREVMEGLELLRCRAAQPCAVVVAVRTAPRGAESMTLEPLAAECLHTLALATGETDERARAAASEARGNAGWMLATLGKVPASLDVLRDRAATLSIGARELLGAVAVLGGRARESWCSPLDREAFATLAEAGLLDRDARGHHVELVLSTPSFAEPLARELGSFALSDRLAVVLLEDAEPSASALLSLARDAHPPARRAQLLATAAEVARHGGARAEEMDALLGLLAHRSERTPARLARLERISRDASAKSTNERVVAWMEDAALANQSMSVLLARRRAEAAARRGDYALATASIATSREQAIVRGDAEGAALATATSGLVLLLRAQWSAALEELREARRLVTLAGGCDAEEVARLDHNLGVVAVYRGAIDEAVVAFERALATKTVLGDLAGVRACLRNLGYALTRAARYDEAASSLDAAMSLADSLEQTAGKAWCLSARAEVEVRRGEWSRAKRLLAEGRAMGQDAPAAVRADLSLLVAEIGLAEGDAARAEETLAQIDETIRVEDPLVDSRALSLSSRAMLQRLPADRRQSARLAIRALRSARTAGLPEAESLALAALSHARSHARSTTTMTSLSASPPPVRYPSSVGTEPPNEIWSWLARASRGASAAESRQSLLQDLTKQSGAERAFFVIVDPRGEIVSALGTDLDGLPIADAERRVALETLAATVAASGPVYQPSIATGAGNGSRLAIAARAPTGDGHVILLLEHRFLEAKFDHVSQTTLEHAVILAALSTRFDAPSRLVAAPVKEQPVPSEHEDASTVQPATASLRAFPTILGKSESLNSALAKLDRAIDSELPVLLLGETGVGKELFARALHEQGAHRDDPFVAVNCAALTDSLFEAELFGHARGAFTGADKSRRGLVASAENGTLFLDEIGELSLARQASLLRLLESQRYRPVGSDEERAARCRVVTATNRDLDESVREGEFRQDLLFRLDVLSIRIPPLRERSGDVAILLRKFFDDATSRTKLSPSAEAALASYPWPGNVRELSHVVARLVALRLPKIELAHLPRELRRAPNASEPPPTEIDQLKAALGVSKGNLTHAARALGLTRHGLKKRMVRLGIRAATGSDRGSDDT